VLRSVRVDVRLFAMLRSWTGTARYALELPDGADVAAAWAALVADFPDLAPAGPSVRFARNGRYVETDATLAPGDELAVIPPVAGGADRAEGAEEAMGSGLSGAPHPTEEPGPRIRHLAVIEDPLDGRLDALRGEVATPADGAVTSFLGQTRESPGTPAPGQESEAARLAGGRVVGLTYEAFEPMVLAVLEEIADEIETRFGVRRIAMVHRVGAIAVGEASVAIVVASPHRDTGFGACRYAIEELKARAPIWKEERYADGSVWIGAPARSHPPPPER
jgi:molybdopterin synthase catalytic subunit